MKFAVKKATCGLLVVLSFLLLFAAKVLRWKYNAGNFIGVDSYFQLHLAQQGGLHVFEPLLSGGVPFFAEPGWPFLLSFAPELLGHVLPVLFGVLTLVVFLLLLQKVDFFTRMLAGLFLIISPPFLYLFSSTTKFAPAAFLSLLAVYVYYYHHRHLGLFFVGLVALFSVSCAVLLFILYLGFVARKARWSENLLYTCTVVLFFLICVYPLFSQYGFPGAILLKQAGLVATLNSTFIEFGSLDGFGIFLFLLALCGGTVYYAKQYRFLWFYLGAIVVIVLAAYLPATLYLANFALAFFAALGYKYLSEKKWNHDTLRQLALLVIVCGVLFSSTAYVNELTQFSPSYHDIRATEFLSTQPPGALAAPANYGSWLLQAQHPIVLSTQTLYVPDAFTREDALDLLYTSDDIEDTLTILHTYDIKYIWIDEDIKQAYWDGRSDRGFLAATIDNPLFHVVYSNGDVQLVEYAYV